MANKTHALLLWESKDEIKAYCPLCKKTFCGSANDQRLKCVGCNGGSIIHPSERLGNSFGWEFDKAKKRIITTNNSGRLEEKYLQADEHSSSEPGLITGLSELVIEDKADPAISSQGAAHDARTFVRSGNSATLKILLDSDTELLKDRKENDRTLLMEAALWGQLDCVKLLLEQNADPNAENGRGLKAIDFAQPSMEMNKERMRLADSESTKAPLNRAKIVELLSFQTVKCRELANPLRKVETQSHYVRSPATVPSSDKGREDIPTVYIRTRELIFEAPRIEGEWPLNKYQSLIIRKCVACLDRGLGYEPVFSLSSYTNTYDVPWALEGSKWTGRVKELAGTIQLGRINCFEKKDACHAELQLVAYFLDRHVPDDTDLEWFGQIKRKRLSPVPSPTIYITKPRCCPFCVKFLNQARAKFHPKLNGLKIFGVDDADKQVYPKEADTLQASHSPQDT